MSSGGRHPFLGQYKVGFTSEGRITALNLKLYSNGGCSMDLSIPVSGQASLFFINFYLNEPTLIRGSHYGYINLDFTLSIQCVTTLYTGDGKSSHTCRQCL